MNSKKEINKQKIVIFLGAPGSGKGTQANLLADKLGLCHLETSFLIEKELNGRHKKDILEIEGKKYSFKKEINKWKTGELLNPNFVLFLIKKKIKELSQDKKGIILSGSPRTLLEAKELTSLLKKLFWEKNIRIFFLKISIKQSIWRNSHRKICELMRHSILYNEETSNLTLCPLDGSKLITRELDKPAIIRKRYNVFEKKTLPILRYIKDQGFKIQEINAEQSVASVFKDILSYIPQDK